jgi:putative restriction endonuclease
LPDAAFDQGFISFDDDYRLILSPRLKDSLSQRAVQENFVAYEGSPLQIPEDAKLPNPAFLAEQWLVE